MFLKWVKLANSIRVGNKEEIFLDGKKFDLYLVIRTNLVLIRDKVHHDAHAITTMANVIYTDSEEFPHHFFDETEIKPVKKVAGERAKPSKTATAN